MAFLTRTLLVLWLAGCATLASAADPARFIALSYHEVLSDSEPLTPTAVRASDLARQFAWLAANGWQPVSIEQILAARSGGQPLPDKAILLTFDDGKKDVYTRAFPLLKFFRYPAVIALVGEWLEVPPGGTVDYDGKPLPRSEFVTWDEVRKMTASGLVEVASHAYDLHRGLPSNPQGNTQPAAIVRHYLGNGRYESDTAYAERIRQGLLSAIAKRTGQAPRVIVWPYGRSNDTARKIAADLGMNVGLTLEDGWNDNMTPLASLRRHLIEHSPSLEEFAGLLRSAWPSDPMRSVSIDPGLWSKPTEEFSRTLDRLQTLTPNIAFLRPVVIQGGVEATLFPTKHRPLAIDVLNHIAWQTERRAGVPVFIDLPASWLNEPELVGDLARQVSFAGLRVTAEPDDPRLPALREAAGRWRKPVQLALASDHLPTAETLTRLPAGDLVVIPAWLVAGGTLPAMDTNARNKLLIEFDPLSPAEETARRMRALEADGFRNFGLSSFPEPLSAEVANVLSLRAQPQLR